MNKSSCPGPDLITINIFKKAGPSFHNYFISILNACLSIGYFPKPWKKENRIYTKKADKDNYHTEKSYRPLSLSNILAKYLKELR
jgi:hypothetical protein